MLILYAGPSITPSAPPTAPMSMEPTYASPEDQALSGLGWNILHREGPSPGCVNCVAGLGATSNGISSGLTILGVLAFAAIAITVVNWSKK